MWTSPKHFIVQTSPEGLFRFEGPAFESVQELIIHQVFNDDSANINIYLLNKMKEHK